MNLVSYILFAALVVFQSTALPTETIAGQFRTYVGSSLSPEDSAPAISFEPLVAVTFLSKTTLSFLSNIVRPFNRYENFKVPIVRTRVKQDLGISSDLGTAFELTGMALDIDRWSNEGSMVRTSVGLVLEKRVLNNQLLIQGKAVPYYQFNAYRQTTDGITKPEYGVGEVVALELKTGRTTLSADISFYQSFHSVWKNSYATTQEIAYNFTDNWSLGAGHALLGSFIDESTGRYSSLKVFDSRQSRVSAFMGYEF